MERGQRPGAPGDHQQISLGQRQKHRVSIPETASGKYSIGGKSGIMSYQGQSKITVSEIHKRGQTRKSNTNREHENQSTKINKQKENIQGLEKNLGKNATQETDRAITINRFTGKLVANKSQ